MTLDLNALAVESFETDPGAELMARPRHPTDDVILCAAEHPGAYLAGGPTNEVILC